MWLVIPLVGLLALGLGTAYWLESRRLPKKRARLANRESLSIQDLYLKYYGGTRVQQEAFNRIWETAARELNLDATKLRPSDRFDQELAPVKGHLVEDELVALNEYYVAECRRLGVANPPRLQTLNDLVMTLSSGSH